MPVLCWEGELMSKEQKIDENGKMHYIFIFNKAVLGASLNLRIQIFIRLQLDLYIKVTENALNQAC